MAERSTCSGVSLVIILDVGEDLVVCAQSRAGTATTIEASKARIGIGLEMSIKAAAREQEIPGNKRDRSECRNESAGPEIHIWLEEEMFVDGQPRMGGLNQWFESKYARNPNAAW